jgi:HAD superfamily phosphatase (TIGR01668 family)
MKKKYNSLSKLMTPDFMFEHYYDITPEFLLSQGIEALLIDIDNTLAPYEQDVPDERIISWFDSLKSAGIRSALISNNHPPRVELFNTPLGLPAYADSGKPGKKTLLIAMKEMGSTFDNTAGLGDQLFTDTLAVHKLGMPSLIVPPIKDKTTLFFRSKRFLERPFIKKYKKTHADSTRTVS